MVPVCVSSLTTSSCFDSHGSRPCQEFVCLISELLLTLSPCWERLLIKCLADALAAAICISLLRRQTISCSSGVLIGHAPPDCFIFFPNDFQCMECSVLKTTSATSATDLLTGPGVFPKCFTVTRCPKHRSGFRPKPIEASRNDEYRTGRAQDSFAKIIHLEATNTDRKGKRRWGGKEHVSLARAMHGCGKAHLFGQPIPSSSFGRFETTDLDMGCDCCPLAVSRPFATNPVTTQQPLPTCL